MTGNPFGEMFGDIFSMLGQQGPDAWFTTATQLALNIARGEDSDPNPLPIERHCWRVSAELCNPPRTPLPYTTWPRNARCSSLEGTMPS